MVLRLFFWSIKRRVKFDTVLRDQVQKKEMIQIERSELQKIEETSQFPTLTKLAAKSLNTQAL